MRHLFVVQEMRYTAVYRVAKYSKIFRWPVQHSMDPHRVDCAHETTNGFPLSVRESVILPLDLFAGPNGQRGLGISHSAIQMLTVGETTAEDAVHRGAASFRNVKEDQNFWWLGQRLLGYFRTKHRKVAPGTLP